MRRAGWWIVVDAEFRNHVLLMVLKPNACGVCPKHCQTGGVTRILIAKRQNPWNSNIRISKTRAKQRCSTLNCA
eukprot:2305292-Lingulodinium_polyedra.AAC.1